MTVPRQAASSTPHGEICCRGGLTDAEQVVIRDYERWRIGFGRLLADEEGRLPAPYLPPCVGSLEDDAHCCLRVPAVRDYAATANDCSRFRVPANWARIVRSA
jgi:hypothetical protein